jgi:lipopolysaccharide/colanic/teichoic acid biosynthesis glycosyltransferase
VASDALTVLLTTWLVRVLFADSLGLQDAPLSAFTAIAATAMVVTIFAFTGAYSRAASPLDIANTEGLVRGICCAMVLVLLSCAVRQMMPSPVLLWSGGVAVYLLIVQREIVHVLARRRAASDWVRAQAIAERVGAQNMMMVRRRDRTAYAAKRWVVSSGLREVREPHSPSRVASEWDIEPVVTPAPLAKRAMDMTVALLLLVMAAPLFVVAAALIKIESRGPVFFRQRRVGKDGRHFFMWKFRSMCQNAPRYERSPISDTDLRLTAVGRILRRLSLDELPQLINVVTGEMSLVGPRPEMPFIVARYGPRERQRLQATPGITGLWQISPARAMPIHENVELDLFYIERQNVFLDIAILVRTFTAVIRGVGAT